MSSLRLIAGLMPGLLLVMLNTTVLGLASTELTNGLDSDRYRIQCIAASFSVGFMAGCMITGLLAGQAGLRWTFVSSLALFALAAGLSGAADTVAAMALPRLLQGLALGVALTSSMMLLWQRFPSQLAEWMALYGTILFAGALVGAPLGGLLTTWFSWRGIFYAQLPLGVLAVLAACWGLPDDRPAVRKPLQIDLTQLVLTLGWLACGTVVLDMGQFWGWFDSRQLVSWLAAFAILFAGFVAWGLLRPAPLISLRPLLRPRYAAAVVVLAVYGANIYVLTALLSVYLIDLRGYQWWQGSAIWLPALLGMLTTVGFGLGLGHRVSGRLWLLVGVVLMAAITWRLTALDLYTPKESIALLLACWGGGVGLATVPAMQAVFHELTAAEAFQQAGIFNLNRFLPAFVVSATLTTLLSRQTDAELDRLRLTAAHNRPAIQRTLQHVRGDLTMRNVLANGTPRQAPAALSQWVRINARAFAVQTVLRYLAWLTAAGAGLALAAALFGKRFSAASLDVGQRPTSSSSGMPAAYASRARLV